MKLIKHLFIYGIIFLLVIISSTVNAQVTFTKSSPVVVKTSKKVAKTFVPPPVEYLRKANNGTNAATQSATFNVTYTGFTPEAQAAFQYAVDIWASLITSSVPIEIDAEFIPMSSIVLGNASAIEYANNFPGQPMSNTLYPIALANKLSGFDLNPDNVDIKTNFNSAYTGWYFETDGNPPPGTSDFITVVLHEIGHGLGFSSTANYDDGIVDDNNIQECDNIPDHGCFIDIDIQGNRIVYDHFVENGNGMSILSFPNFSLELGAEFTSDNLFWNGVHALAASGNNSVKLYAPASFAPGSSYVHLDEATYPAGTINSLMTPIIYSQEANHNPGPIALGMLADMGWIEDEIIMPCVDQVLTSPNDDISGYAKIEAPTNITATNTIFTRASVRYDSGECIFLQKGFVVESRSNFFAYIDGCDGVLKNDIANNYEVVNHQKTSIQNRTQKSRCYPNPFTDETIIEYTITDKTHVDIVVYNASGAMVRSLAQNESKEAGTYQVTFDGSHLPSGIYFYTITTDNLSETQQMILMR